MRHSLRTRIFAVCFGVSTGVSVLFGALALVAFEALEFEQIDHVLDAELSRFMHRGASAGAAPDSRFVTGWSAALNDLQTLPAGLRELPPGRFEVDLPGGEMRVLVGERDDRRYVVGMALAITAALEDRVGGAVLVLVVVCSLLGALLGRSLARRVAEPVTRLAAQVSSGAPLTASAELTQGQRNDEIGALAHAIQDYAQRMQDYATREHEFTAHVSHELRTPLAVASSAVELLLDDKQIGESSRRRLLGAGRSLAGMHETVEALLTLARTEAGTGTDADVDIGVLLDETIEQCRALLGERSVELVRDYQARPVLRTLPGALRIVLRNLLANACAYTVRGEIVVRLADDVVSVRDTGPGISAAELPRITDGGFRGAGAHGDGEGLGLAIAQRLCEHYGWRLEVTSAAGVGTTVTLHFG